MHHFSYVRKLRSKLPTRATTLVLALSFVFCSTAGCTQPAQPPLAVAFGGFTYTPDSSGLADMLRRYGNASVEEQKSSLKSFADSQAQPEARQKANYVLARLLHKSGARKDLEEAIPRYREAAKYLPLFVRSQMHIGEIGLTLGDEKLAQEALSAIPSNPQVDSPRDEAAALYDLGRSLIRAGEKSKARQHFAMVQQIAPDSQYAIGAEYFLADIDLHEYSQAATAGGTRLMANEAALDQALARYRRYLEASPDGRFAENVMVEMELRFPLTKRDHELFAAAYYARGHYAKALEEWRKAGNTSQWYKQGVAQIRTGNATAGKATLLNGIRNHPNDDSVEEAATMLARMSNSQGAVDVWNLVAQRSSRFADVALWNLGIRAATHPASLGYYRQILSKYPTSRYAPESAWWLVWEEIKNGRGSAVVPQLHTYAARYADARAGTRFAYWAGKVYEKQGKKPQALAAYQQTINIRPWDYYAYRAQNRMAALNGGRDEGWRTDPTRRVSWLQDSSANWDWPEPPQELAQQHGTTIATLNELRQWDECIELVPKDAGALRGFYMAKMDMPLQAINAAVPDLKGKPQRSEIWELAYPLVYAKQIAREGPRVRVDPLLVQALIREESRYNPAAVSSSNALGLMQLLPGTAYGVAKRLGIKLNSHADIHQPATNIALGTDYLGYVHRRHNDNSLFAVASYNGGPNAVARWVKTMPTDTDVFVENIPYRETRDYVRKVFGSYWNYRAIYGS